ncbi:hypothetical protein [Halodesulfovibrio aestuarii]|uniref:hypothetical protein n=1 Tax=Halodesulfovibrio aestuarii TaxID=126333 RepID=UPI000427EC00
MQKGLFKLVEEGNEKVHLDLVQLVSEKKIAELERWNSVLHDYNRLNQKMEYVQDNFEDFNKCVVGLVEAAHERGGAFSYPDHDQIMREIRRTLLNLMMSIRTLLDHMETSVKRQFGKKSEQADYLKSLTSHEFDTCFAYGFFYKLRNYVQHCSMPPLVYSENIIIKSNPSELEIKITLVRDSLLDGFTKWGAVKSHLEAAPERIDLISIVKDVMKSINNIYIKYAIETSYEDTLAAKAGILAFIGEDDSYSLEEYFIGTLMVWKDGRFDFSTKALSTGIFRKVKKLEEWAVTV